jgi:hypothetical protein
MFIAAAAVAEPLDLIALGDRLFGVEGAAFAAEELFGDDREGGCASRLPRVGRGCAAEGRGRFVEALVVGARDILAFEVLPSDGVLVELIAAVAAAEEQGDG